MSNINLQGYKVDKIEFVSLLENGTKVKLGNSYSYNVRYSKENNYARGEFDIEVYDQNQPDKFKVHVVMVGMFRYNTEVTKEVVHTETFKALFPYVKCFITTLTANCGIPPIMIPEIDIDNQQIYRFDQGEN